ncbi:uncharacterized protein LOC135366815 [Ornithodoros turicata]|uniref:uncharacterized protein LOC135366815 n=1 Tax=Ornithodoros turicata TaxID=34597 RepID=UPI003139A055
MGTAYFILRIVTCTLLFTLTCVSGAEHVVHREASSKVERHFSGSISLDWLASAVSGMFGRFSGTEKQVPSPQPSPPAVNEGMFSLSKQVGLAGLNRLVSEMSQQERSKAMEQTRIVYCDRMNACKQGQDLIKGHQTMAEAVREVDMDAKYLDSILMGMSGVDCEKKYRGCKDFH